MKQGSLFCFVTLRSLEAHDPSCHTLGIFGKLSMSMGAPTWLETVWSYMWKLLIIQSFSEWKLKKNQNWKLHWNLGDFQVLFNALGESNLIESISQFSELSCGRYEFFSGFCCWKFLLISKIGFGRKIQVSPQCVHTWANDVRYTSLNK